MVSGQLLEERGEVGVATSHQSSEQLGVKKTSCGGSIIASHRCFNTFCQGSVLYVVLYDVLRFCTPFLYVDVQNDKIPIRVRDPRIFQQAGKFYVEVIRRRLLPRLLIHGHL